MEFRKSFLSSKWSAYIVRTSSTALTTTRLRVVAWSFRSEQMSKYYAKKVVTEQGTFDSKKEYQRYLELKQLEAAGTIRELRRQTEFTLIPSQKIAGKTVERPVKYKADFDYFTEDNVYVVEDVKSEYTRKLPEYIIKRKLLLYLYGIKLREII